MVLGRIVGLLVHAEHQGVVGIGGRSGDDHFLHRPANVLSRVGTLGEQASRFDDDGRAHRRPVNFRRIFRAEHFEGFAVHGDGVVGVAHLIGKIAQDGIVFEQVGERL